MFLAPLNFIVPTVRVRLASKFNNRVCRGKCICSDLSRKTFPSVLCQLYTDFDSGRSSFVNPLVPQLFLWSDS